VKQFACSPDNPKKLTATKENGLKPTKKIRILPHLFIVRYIAAIQSDPAKEKTS
jgi:hypothetical protein